MNEKRSASRSDAQHAVEIAAIESLGKTLGVVLSTKRILFQGRRFDVDGYYEDRERIILAEVWAHIGKAKAAQRNKVLSDLLKLALISRLFSREQPHLQVSAYLTFIDTQAAHIIQNESWGALAAREFGINVVIVTIDSMHYEAVRIAQINQDLRAQFSTDAQTLIEQDAIKASKRD